MELQPPGFPVGVKCASVHLGSSGDAADLICCTYLDGAVLMVNQLGTIGTVVLAKQDSTFEGKATFSTSTLVGKRDEPLLTIAARQLVEHAHSKGFAKPLICCLALKEHTPEVIKQLLAAVQQHSLF